MRRIKGPWNESMDLPSIDALNQSDEEAVGAEFAGKQAECALRRQRFSEAFCA